MFVVTGEKYCRRGVACGKAWQCERSEHCRAADRGVAVAAVTTSTEQARNAANSKTTEVKRAAIAQNFLLIT